MATPNELVVRLSAVTPIFIGGAEPNEYAELRPPSIKGLLRYWYRAIDGEYRKIDGSGKNGGARVPTKEERLFGSTRGQSPCLVRVDGWRIGKQTWEASGNSGRGYLGYSLRMKPNDRRMISVGTSFTLRIRPRPGRDRDRLRQAWIASVWLLVHVGGLGSRSRRGFGSLTIEEWDGWKECGDLELACQGQDADEWADRFVHGIERLRSWFSAPNSGHSEHSSLVPGSLSLLIDNAHSTWSGALEDAGVRLKSFRMKREPDYTAVRRQLSGQGRMMQAPVRAAFGLPLTFHFPKRTRGMPGGGELTIRAEVEDGKGRSTIDRMASPLVIRIVKLRDGYHALFTLLPGPLLPSAVTLTDGSNRWPVSKENKSILRQFIDTTVAPDAVEVEW